MKLFTKVPFTRGLILAPSGKQQCILSREKEGGRQPLSLLLVNAQPTALDSTEDGTLGAKNYHVLQSWWLAGPRSMLLSQWLCNFLPVPFLPQAILPIFLFLQSGDVRLSLFILGNLLYMPAAANLNGTARICKAEVHQCICSPAMKRFPSEGFPAPAHFCVGFCSPKPAAVFFPPDIF